MRAVILPLLAFASLAASPSLGDAPSPVPVNADNFPRAETDLYFGSAVKDSGGLAVFNHHRKPMSIDHQAVIRANRDTLYSSAVFDLDAGPVTVTLPDAGKRFMSMQVFDEDQYTHAVDYTPGKHVFTKGDIGTRYMMVAVRTLVDPSDPKDVEAVHKLQDTMTIEQENRGTFEVPRWDPVSQKKVRDALLVLGSTLPDGRRMFGSRAQVDPVRYLIGSASAWGGNPDKDAMYLNIVPPKNDGTTVYKLHVNDVPVDGFWSISVYNAKGYYEKNDRNAYTLNNLTAKKGGDGSVDIQFGGCQDGIPNCLPIMNGWNYMVRLYRPHPEILDGKWKFPEAAPAS